LLGDVGGTQQAQVGVDAGGLRHDDNEAAALVMGLDVDGVRLTPVLDLFGRGGCLPSAGPDSRLMQRATSSTVSPSSTTKTIWLASS